MILCEGWKEFNNIAVEQQKMSWAKIEWRSFVYDFSVENIASTITLLREIIIQNIQKQIEQKKCHIDQTHKT